MGTLHVDHLTGGTLRTAPPCCRECTWWQTRAGGRDIDKRRWIEDVEERSGAWGKLYLEGERVIASLQYAPAAAFPRARDVPAGPPSDDAVLVTCAFIVDTGSPWALQSLFLACIGETRDAGRCAIEAFAYRYDDGAPFGTRFLHHRTVFPRDFLADFGFRTLRSAGRVELMRLNLRGLVPVDDASTLDRAIEALRERARRAAAAPAAP